MQAILAYCKINQDIIQVPENQKSKEEYSGNYYRLTPLEATGIIEKSVRVVLNSVVFDPLVQMQISNRFMCAEFQDEIQL